MKCYFFQSVSSMLVYYWYVYKILWILYSNNIIYSSNIYPKLWKVQNFQSFLIFYLILYLYKYKTPYIITYITQTCEVIGFLNPINNIYPWILWEKTQNRQKRVQKIRGRGYFRVPKPSDFAHGPPLFKCFPTLVWSWLSCGKV